MAITQTNTQIVNTAGLGAQQTGALTTKLTNGGYVVAWSTNIGGQSDILFQRYDALGNTVGGPTAANTTTAGDQVLTDIVATADGRFTLAWTSGTNAVTRSFLGANGGATSAEVVTALGTTATGAQLIAVSASSYKLVATSENAANRDYDQATYTTAGAVVTPPSTIGTFAGSILELVDGNVAGEQIALSESGIAISTNGTSILISPQIDDILKLQNGLHVLAPSVNSSMGLVAFTGAGGDLSGYTVDNTNIVGSVFGGAGQVNQAVFDREIVNIGGGRILVLWVADTGHNFVSGADPDGIYAVVYNTNTGSSEAAALALATFGQGGISAVPDLQAISISAEVLLDGRVAVTWNQRNGLTNQDVFTRILDARTGPVTVAGTTGADAMVGTAFDDTFSGNLGADVIDGGAGSDTASYAAIAAAIKVDLQNAILNTGEAASDTLISIENIIGTGLADELYGNAVANALAGGAGDDKLFGRDGADALNGDAGADLADGGAGDDFVNGGDGNDTLVGGLGADTMNGGLNDDTINGGDGDDSALGGDGIDKIYGAGGNDNLQGQAGNDFIVGGDGDDTIAGGDSNDTINGGNGNDVIDGGLGNDVIAAGAGLNVVDGGLGTDAVTYANILGSGGTEFYVDLDPAADPIGNMDGFTADDDLLIGIENILGSEGNDYLAGNAGNNVLRGNGGNDTFLARSGGDTVIGGAGNDRLIIENTASGSDTFADFTQGQDKIVIVSSGFANVNGGTAVFTSNATATVAASGSPQFIFDNAGAADLGRLFFDADGNGAGAAIQVAVLKPTLPGAVVLNISDFEFI
ncbi:MAG: calcium-binding protein [Aestuariivirga sp.]